MNYKDKQTGYFSGTRPELYTFYKNIKGKWLDIGCGDGSFASGICEINPNVKVSGIEPNTILSDSSSIHFEKFYNQSIESALSEIQKKTFDVISFNDVLEHLINPKDILSNCKEKLSEGGKIYASIPNFLFFPSIFEIICTQDFKYRDHGILDNTHIRFFTKKSIEQLFKDSGYEIELIYPINPKTFEKLWLYQLINFFCFGKITDWRYMQFFIIAKPK